MKEQLDYDALLAVAKLKRTEDQKLCYDALLDVVQARRETRKTAIQLAVWCCIASALIVLWVWTLGL